MPKRPRLVSETPDLYVIHDGTAPFRVPKAGLSDKLHAQIKALAPVPGEEGGGFKVERFPAGVPMHSKEGGFDVERTQPLPPPSFVDRAAGLIKGAAGAILPSAAAAEPPPVPPTQRELEQQRMEQEALMRDMRIARQAPSMADLTPNQYARGGQVPGYADGGAMPDGGYGPPVADAAALPPRQDTGPFVVAGQDMTPSVKALAPLVVPGGMLAQGWQGLTDIRQNMVEPAVNAAKADVAAVTPLARQALHAAAPSVATEADEPAAAAPPPRAPPPTSKHAPAKAGGSLAAHQAAPAAVPPEQQAAIDLGKAREAEAAQTAKEHGAYASQMMADNLETQRIAAEAHAQGQAILAKHQAVQDEMARVTGNVDPDRYWASRSTGGKIAGALALVLGAVGAGADGVNRAAGMIDKAIDRDIEAQKAEHTIRLARGKALAEGYSTMYSQAHQMAGDDLAAKALARSSALGITEQKLAQLAALGKGAAASPEAQMLAAELKQKKQTADATAEHLIAESQLARAQAKKAAGGKPADTAGAAALERLKQAFGQTGGIGGAIGSKAPFVMTDAKAYDAQAPADAMAIATHLAGNKLPRPATVEMVQNMLPKSSDKPAVGQAKIRAIEKLMTTPASGEEAMSPEELEQ